MGEPASQAAADVHAARRQIDIEGDALVSEPKFTPGPWSIGRIDATHGHRIVPKDAANIDQLGRVLAWATAPIFPEKAGESEADYKTRREIQEKANAHLIAAAPDLYAALNAAIKIADEAREEWDKAPEGMRAGKILIALAGGCPGYRADIDAIHAALAKAEGPA